MVDEVFFHALQKNINKKIKKQTKAEKENLKNELSVFQEKKVVFNNDFPFLQRIEVTNKNGKETYKHYELKDGLKPEELIKDPNWRNNMDYWQEVDVN
ncbi:MAG TPA: hypothetical protein PKI94_00640 [Candidatus Gastranaerophilaceae bacterium]|nr:hypothetical protein [Candidatus Gastranaerophilaceae bacterium]